MRRHTKASKVMSSMELMSSVATIFGSTKPICNDLEGMSSRTDRACMICGIIQPFRVSCDVVLYTSNANIRIL
jgi:hypothetical protein